MSMQGKVIAISGGASGIGLATAKLLSSRGAKVMIGDIDWDALKSASEFFKSNNRSYNCRHLDVSDRESVQDWIDEILMFFGRLDGAANCAGIIGKHHGIKNIQDMEDEEWNKIIAVNLTGMMYCLRAELGAIVDGGSIVNVASIQGTQGFAGSGAYVASKHGVIGLTRSAAKEVGDRNIRVNAVAPGSIETPLLNQAREIKTTVGTSDPTVIKRTGTAEEIAAIIAFLLSEESSFVTGAVYAGDGGWGA
ncbi:3-oxoacyl-[acyl-carrier-protein] reductase [Sclerotinia borealis F-4128]|uniref:Short-chain dehydrogenase/reductase ABA4 n=1 Tax=Sclerotinia borealis (strain F-4128) TaxID=1432307 RepID=W9C6S8_SCLBF|nr:3-oxoacyl-[acyl-carrier-protein] reductase [Sclerotinia borealis F-4128]